MGLWKSGKGVETDDTPGVIVRLKDGGAVRPRHQATAGEDSTLHDTSVYSKVQFENLITH